MEGGFRFCSSHTPAGMDIKKRVIATSPHVSKQRAHRQAIEFDIHLLSIKTRALDDDATMHGAV